jgi:hypothetical protein
MLEVVEFGNLVSTVLYFYEAHVRDDWTSDSWRCFHAKPLGAVAPFVAAAVFNHFGWCLRMFATTSSWTTPPKIWLVFA